jgi:hypothetical protein
VTYYCKINLHGGADPQGVSGPRFVVCRYEGIPNEDRSQNASNGNDDTSRQKDTHTDAVSERHV